MIDDVRTLIRAKRDGHALTAEQVGDLVAGYVAGDVDDAQMAALLMAGLLRGLSEAEAVALTDAFVRSGQTVDLSGMPRPSVDKHSTGGVGDTTTLVVGPIVAACGLAMAKLSGRALGHTGGTLDKLESIPGLTTDLTADQVRRQADEVGLVVAAATTELVPADRRVYALRDRTDTVDHPALIAASVMSKKIAGGAQHIVLDVKTGGGAFLPVPDDARALGELCVAIGAAHGRATTAVVSDMSQPLGQAVGNTLEVREAVRVLGGEDTSPRLRELSLVLAAALIDSAGGGGSGRQRAADALASGAAREAFRRFVAAQGGDPAVADDPDRVLGRAAVVREWVPPAGTVTAVACRELGVLAHRLAGPGHDPRAGLEVAVAVGDRLDGRTPAVRVHASDEAAAERALAALPELVAIGDGEHPPQPLIHVTLEQRAGETPSGTTGGER